MNPKTPTPAPPPSAPALPADHLRTALRAGLAYVALVFALGFVLGVVRTLAVGAAPGPGRLAGVLVELPLMLWASWQLCRWLVRRLAVPPTGVARALMGGVALALLLLAELGLGALLSGRTPAQHLALYLDPSYALGLAAQLAFGLMPWLQWRLQGRLQPP